MKSPSRINEILSPPYVVVKDEDDIEKLNQSKSHLMPPLSTAKSLYHFYAIVKAAQGLGISNEACPNIIDRNYNSWNNIVRLDLREMATDPDGSLRFFNSYLVNSLSRAEQSPYLDCFEGTYLASYSFYYLSSNRDMSFKDLLYHHRHKEVIVNQMERLILAVSHMHELGLVHRNLCPEVVFQSNEEKRPFFIAGHDYTTQISNKNQSHNMPDNKYVIRDITWRAGSKKQDLCALGGIIMAWQIGIIDYNKVMRRKIGRMEQA